MLAAILIVLTIIGLYHAIAIWQWLLATLILFVASYYFAWFSMPALIVLGVVVILLTYFSCPFIRRKTISPLIMLWVKNKIPSLSETEKQALEAGDVWWDSDLLQGRPNWNKLKDLKPLKLTAEEQHFLDNQVEVLCSMLSDWEDSNNRDFSKEVWEYIKKEKFFAMIIPKQYGGLQFSEYAHSQVVTKIATRSVAAAVTVMVPNSLGPAELLLNFGTDEQKQKYLPALATAEEIPCFGLTGVEAGSDAGSIADTGIICEQEFNGKKSIGIKLSWNKRYITLAPVATVLGLAVRVFDPDKLLGDKEDIGITLCLIPTSHPGVIIGRRHSPLDLAFMNGPTQGKDVFVPLDWVIGGKAQLGNGWRMLMECLAQGRGISLPALSAAAAQVGFKTTGAYASVRHQFNVPIGKFEGVEQMLAVIGGEAYTVEAARYLTLMAVEYGGKPAICTAIAKYNMTEKARLIVNHSMDVHAGKGIIKGPRNYLSTLYQSIPISITVEGANILTRNLIIFGQGAVRCHPYLFSEIKAVQNKDVKAFDKAFFSHLGYTISSFVRLVVLTLTGGYFCCLSQPRQLRRMLQQLTWMSAALSLITDIVLLLLGGKLKIKERLSARLADVLSNLYLASAAIKYYVDNGSNKEELVFLRWAVNSCLLNIQSALLEFFSNFPNRLVALKLRILTFPFGAPFKKLGDKIDKQIAANLLQASEFRDRITSEVYVGDCESEPLYNLEKAFNLMQQENGDFIKFKRFVAAKAELRMAPIEIKVEAAVKAEVIAADKAEFIKDLEHYCGQVIAVDDFEF